MATPGGNVNLGQDILDQLHGWVNSLVVPALPLRATLEGGEIIRLEFRQQIPQSVMIGKLVRAVSGLRGALVLAQAGYITECAAVLRIVSDFCTEISVIGFALHRGDDLPTTVKDFVAQYFTPRARTPEELAATDRRRFVSREALMKIHKELVNNLQVDSSLLERSHRFVNEAYDAYVHGACETTMELWNPPTHSFEMGGHPSTAKREEFVGAVFLKMHEVVVAAELTAAVTAHAEVFAQAREARRTMDASKPWKYRDGQASA
jgi:hypothetical protein